MRLLSFLSDIERAIRLEANAGDGEVWDSARIVNFPGGLARLTMTARELDSGMPQGTVVVQHFRLANGSFCLKASLTWQGSEVTTTLSVYETPALNWKLEAGRIASAWLSGPPAETSTASSSDADAESIVQNERVAALG